MAELCFVLIESVQVGCRVEAMICGVTKDQQYAYNWQQSIPEFASGREARQVPLVEP